MHYSFRSAALTSAILLGSSPAFADLIQMAADVREVTLYPRGASVIREATGNIPAGVHQIVISGLPRGTDPDTLRVSVSGLVLGAFSLQTDRSLPQNISDSPQVDAARKEVFRLERELRARDAKTASIRAEGLLAGDMVGVMKSLAKSNDANVGDVAALTDFIEGRLLAVRRAGIDAETRALASEQGREQDVRELAIARDKLVALEAPDTEQSALVLNVESRGDPAQITITSNIYDAGWRPVYDLRLNESDKVLTLDRGLMVSQSSGEDWRDIKLILSTARPTGQSEPGELQPRFIRTINSEDVVFANESVPLVAPMVTADYAEDNIAAMKGLPSYPVMNYQGSTVIYEYGAPVNLRSGADELRLSLGQEKLPVDRLVAEAVPIKDSSAYLVADTYNSLEEVILPGRATLYADGAMVGMRDLKLVPAGEKIKLGFGPIDGIVLERRTPERQKGDRGIIRRNSELEQVVTLSAKNLTGRDYDLRLIDQVPVSEQDELEVKWSASVDPSETDPDGKRGLLVWDLPLAAGETQEITLESTIRWPEGRQLIE